MKTNKNDSVHPIFDSEGSAMTRFVGITKREYFAAQAMQGILSSSRYYYKNVPSAQVAEEAVEMADELIKALNAQDE